MNLRQPIFLVVLTNLSLQRSEHDYTKQCFSKGNGTGVIQKLFFLKSNVCCLLVKVDESIGFKIDISPLPNDEMH
jgi:hypothetical protein